MTATWGCNHRVMGVQNWCDVQRFQVPDATGLAKLAHVSRVDGHSRRGGAHPCLPRRRLTPRCQMYALSGQAGRAATQLPCQRSRWTPLARMPQVLSDRADRPLSSAAPLPTARPPYPCEPVGSSRCHTCSCHIPLYTAALCITRHGLHGETPPHMTMLDLCVPFRGWESRGQYDQTYQQAGTCLDAGRWGWPAAQIVWQAAASARTSGSASVAVDAGRWSGAVDT